jgi:hypothetical protein
MELHLSRLRRGELIAAAGALALLALMLPAHWYGARTGWQALSAWRWLGLVTIALAFALAYFQAACRAPAIPATLSVLATAVALLNLLWLAFDVLVNAPSHDRVWPYVALIAACSLFYGAFRSLREEGVAPRDERTDIPTVTTGTEVPS